MRIGIVTPVFNEKEYIVPCIKQFDGFNFPHLILVSSKPWRGDYIQDETWALAKANLDNGHVVIDHWEEAADQYNHGISYLQDLGFDWALIVDADEFYAPWDIGRLVGEIRNAPKEIEAIRTTDMSVYWKTTDYRLTPIQRDNPIIAVRTDIRFDYIRNPKEVNSLFSDVEMHHFSYVRNNEQMRMKMSRSAHSHEFDLDKWYNEKWLKWTEDMEDLHPVVPSQFKKAVLYPAPGHIKRLLNE